MGLLDLPKAEKKELEDSIEDGMTDAEALLSVRCYQQRRIMEAIETLAERVVELDKSARDAAGALISIERSLRRLANKLGTLDA